MWRRIDKEGTCPGVIQTEIVGQSVEQDGFYVQVCPLPEMLGTCEYGINYCGNGSDVVVIHSDRKLNDEEILEGIKNACETM